MTDGTKRGVLCVVCVAKMLTRSEEALKYAPVLTPITLFNVKIFISTITQSCDRSGQLSRHKQATPEPP